MQTIETLGPEGPQCYHGSGITLFEVPRDEVPESAVELMEYMFDDTYDMRCGLAEIDDEYWPYPRSPRHCGGIIEFRFLSF